MLVLGIVGLVLVALGVWDFRRQYFLDTVLGEFSRVRFLGVLAMSSGGVLCVTTGFTGNPWYGPLFGLCALVFGVNASLVYATIEQDPEGMSHLSVSAGLLALVAVLSILASFVF